ncbi:hypothetical protein SC1083_2150 [Aggregatibacter actinomycetemcomitans serotype e str. SC1083]|uniref:Uncharacterized protein n=1 Tax=Aggregatibacter actinomycetemcomitans serotype e str. SC1083 TaxID=907488 RepID=G4ABB5_AGGAC|nr:hypothetical protein SC1083_2150 [Aggregatibacter actinomycetemcomitans serotype e str. SC1083]
MSQIILIYKEKGVGEIYSLRSHFVPLLKQRSNVCVCGSID